jgi:hypothetical protein
VRSSTSRTSSRNTLKSADSKSTLENYPTHPAKLFHEKIGFELYQKNGVEEVSKR